MSHPRTCTKEDYTALGQLQALKLVQGAAINPLPKNAGGTPGASASWAAGHTLWRAHTVSAWGLAERSASADSADSASVTTRTALDASSGRITSLKAGLNATEAVLAQTYTHDALSRLVRYQVSHPALPGGQRSVDLTYNALGMLLRRSDVGAYDYTPGSDWRAHNLKRLMGLDGSTTEYSYSTNGNLSKVEQDGTCTGPLCWVDWNSFNQPNSQYGARGPLVAGSGSPRYSWEYDQQHARIKELRQVFGSGADAGLRTTWRMHPDDEGGLGFEWGDNPLAEGAPQSGENLRLDQRLLPASRWLAAHSLSLDSWRFTT